MNHELIRKRQRFQTAYNVAVDFDNVQAVQLFRQRFRYRRQTRADFNHDIFGLRVHGVDNIGNDARILQKILPEAFSGFVFFHDADRWGKPRIVAQTASGRLKNPP